MIIGVYAQIQVFKNKAIVLQLQSNTFEKYGCKMLFKYRKNQAIKGNLCHKETTENHVLVMSL